MNFLDSYWPKTAVNHFTLKAPLSGSMVVSTTFRQKTNQTIVLMNFTLITETLIYVDPITTQTFEYSTQIPYENSSQKLTALDPDTNQHQVITSKSSKLGPYVKSLF